MPNLPRAETHGERKVRKIVLMATLPQASSQMDGGRCPRGNKSRVGLIEPEWSATKTPAAPDQTLRIPKGDDPPLPSYLSPSPEDRDEILALFIPTLWRATPSAGQGQREGVLLYPCPTRARCVTVASSVALALILLILV